MRSVLVVLAISLSACGAVPKHATAPAAQLPAERYLDWDQFHHVYGIDPLPAEQAAGRWHFAFVRDHGEVVEVVRVAPTGEPRDRRKISRGADGSLRADYYDAFGVPEKVVVVDANGYESTTHRSGIQGSGECHHRRFIGTGGVTSEILCYDAANQPLAGNAGCERFRVTRNASFHPIEGECLRADGSKGTFSDGHHRWRAVVDELGNNRSVEYLDVNGAPVASGCAKNLREFGVSGGQTKSRCQTSTGAFVWETRWTYDTHGCKSSISYVDADGHPFERVGVASIHMQNDAKCKELRRETRDSTGKLSGLISVRAYARDELGQSSMQRCWDKHGQGISCAATRADDRHGAEVRYTHDAQGRITQTRCYTIAGAPDTCSASGAFEERVEFGSDGRMRTLSFFDRAGRPASRSGHARETLEWDAFGSLVAVRNWGADGAPVSPPGGCHEMRTTFDAHHLRESVECRDVDGKPKLGSVCHVDTATCFAKGASKIQIVRVGDKVFNVHLDPAGRELLRTDCEESHCIQ
jgi:hypothetical protein